MNTHRSHVLWAPCLMLAAAAWLGFAPPAAAQAATPVTVVHAIRTDVPEYASGIGTVQAYRSVLVRARVDGNLDSINFAEGQTVHPGDLLATIDPRPYAATLAQARAKRGADQALLENARLDLARYDNLVRTNVASRQQADTQAALVNQYLANIQGDDAAIDSAALNLSFCRITAPIEGVTGLRLIDIGNLIHATDATGIVSIMQVHPISLVFTLPQEELPAVRAAIAAEPPSSGGLPVAATGGDGVTPISQGHLVTINNTIDTATGTITLKAEFANTDNKLWPGQFTNGLVRLRTAHDAVTLPPAAIQHGPDGLYVYVVKPDKTVAKQAVMVGYQDERAVIVTAGLSGGETVVLSGQLRLAPGVKVDAHQGGAS